MEITVLFDKEKKDESLKNGWGLSYLINDDILFDTGENFSFLHKNASLLDVDLSRIRHVVISHEHWDHTGGLWNLLDAFPHINVYGCTNFSKSFQDKVIARNATYKPLHSIEAIVPDVFVSGEFKADYKGTVFYEQALIIKQKEALALVCGCAHPGIVQMLTDIQSHFKEKINVLIGGLHLMDKEKRVIEYIITQLKDANITQVFPGHCTGFEALALMRARFKAGCTDVKTGDMISL